MKYWQVNLSGESLTDAFSYMPQLVCMLSCAAGGERMDASETIQAFIR